MDIPKPGPWIGSQLKSASKMPEESTEDLTKLTERIVNEISKSAPTPSIQTEITKEDVKVIKEASTPKTPRSKQCKTCEHDIGVHSIGSLVSDCGVCDCEKFVKKDPYVPKPHLENRPFAAQGSLKELRDALRAAEKRDFNKAKSSRRSRG